MAHHAQLLGYVAIYLEAIARLLVLQVQWKAACYG